MNMTGVPMGSPSPEDIRRRDRSRRPVDKQWAMSVVRLGGRSTGERPHDPIPSGGALARAVGPAWKMLDMLGNAQWTLIGREAETRSLRELMEHVGEQGAALVVRGEAGIGKTALLEEAARIAAGEGFRVLSTSGVEPEAHLAFAGLHKL